ncbi:hypothetical protein GCM10009117_03910 [Gangjinia marincola]|uniref:Uncharacterized protein n=1 Tax=Gangjinia marincola TaxID=578463 RepID=A0ABN1MDW2_9FLAO
MITSQNILWVIRSAGERTVDACKELIEASVPSDHVVLINERPFSAALKKSFQLCTDSTFEWSIHIDADVLISMKGCEELIAKVNQVDTTVFSVQGVTIDKFIPIYRTAGNGMYRNKVLKQALSLIPNDGEALRPEGELIDRMLKKGYQKLRTNNIVGVHDYEQYYRDIYRKVFLHSKKHLNVLGMASNYWLDNATMDRDYTIALLASRVAKYYEGPLFLTPGFQKEEIEVLFHLNDIQEKGPLPKNSFSKKNVSTIVENFTANQDLQQKKYPEYYTAEFLMTLKSASTRTRSALLTSIGSELKRSGKKLIHKGKLDN